MSRCFFRTYFLITKAEGLNCFHFFPLLISIILMTARPVSALAEDWADCPQRTDSDVLLYKRA